MDFECNHKIANTVCSNGKCECKTGYYASSITQCSPGCSKDSACQSIISNSKCISFNCACEAGTRHVTSTNTCVKNNLGEACKTNSDCALIGNAVCQAGVCNCSTGYYVDGTQCKRRVIGDKCSNTADCTAVMPGSDCTTKGICECLIGYHTLTDSSGCKRYQLGDNCTASANCAAGVSGSNCVGGKCQCLSTFDTTSLGQCTPKKLFSSCLKDTDCPGSLNSQCLNGICLCKPGYQPDASNTTCYTVHLHDNCTASSECTKFVNNTFCAANGTCVCIDNYQEQTGTCIASKHQDSSSH